MTFSKLSHDSLISLRIANQKKRITVGLRLFLRHFEHIANSKTELTVELCYTSYDKEPNVDG